MKTMESELVVIGGGIPGVASAYYLAKAGKQVTLLEKGLVGDQESGRNGGGVRQQGRDPAELPFAMASVKIWEKLDDELDADTEYRQWGNIYVTTTEEGLESLRRAGEREQASGLPVEMVDHKGVEELMGTPVKRVIGGKYCPTDGHANPILATKAFGAAAVRLGARVFEHTPVTGIRVNDGEIQAVLAGELEIRTGTVVLAAGLWSKGIGEMLGLQVPLTPVRAQLFVTEQVPQTFRQFIIWNDPDGDVYWRPTLNGNIHAGGATIRDTNLVTHSQESTAPVIEHMAKATSSLFPALAGVSVIRSWCGTIATMPDHIPVIGPCRKVKGLVFATGYSGHGFCLGPVSGKVVAELLTTGKSPIPLDQVGWDRVESGSLSEKPLLFLSQDSEMKQ